MISIDAASYAVILAWGQNNAADWFHPVTRGEFVQGIESLKVGDIVPFVVDGVSKQVKVVSTGANLSLIHI